MVRMILNVWWFINFDLLFYDSILLVASQKTEKGNQSGPGGVGVGDWRAPFFVHRALWPYPPCRQGTTSERGDSDRKDIQASDTREIIDKIR